MEKEFHYMGGWPVEEKVLKYVVNNWGITCKDGENINLDKSIHLDYFDFNSDNIKR